MQKKLTDRRLSERAKLSYIDVAISISRHDDHESSNDHEENQYDQINNKFSIRFDKLILSNMSRNVCTIEQINWLCHWKSAKQLVLQLLI